MIKSKISLYVLLPIVLSMLLIVFLFKSLSQFLFTKGILIDIFNVGNQSNIGGWATILAFVFLFCMILNEEIFKKLLYLKIDGGEIVFKSLISTNKYMIYEIKSIKESVQFSRFGLKSRLITLELPDRNYFISQLYIKNYDELKIKLGTLIKE